jgi:hypothetical protein
MTEQETYERAIRALALQVHKANEKVAFLERLIGAQRELLHDQADMIDLLRKDVPSVRLN